MGLGLLTSALASTSAPPPKQLTPRLSTLKSEIERRALRYFLDNGHPATGLVLDSAPDFTANPADNRMASIAATGFGIAVVANASTRGLLGRDEAYGRVLRALRFARASVPRWHGWFLHFVDWETGARFGESEYSTIDTALFLAGALYAGTVFPGTEAAAIADELYRDLDFGDMLTDGGAQPQKGTLSMGYLPETGYIPSQWSMPAEQMLLVLLGLGHPTHPLPPRVWLSWPRTKTSLADGESLIGADMPLFVHQYSQLFVDFRPFHDAFANYFENGRLGTAFNRRVCRDDHAHRTFQEGFWGLSAGMSPTGYRADSPLDHQGTACLDCVLGSAFYDPPAVLGDAADWIASPYREKIWGRYGFVDGIDLGENWFADRVLGITVGPAYLALADIDDATSIWRGFRSIPAIQTALRLAAQAR